MTKEEIISYSYATFLSTQSSYQRCLVWGSLTFHLKGPDRTLIRAVVWILAAIILPSHTTSAASWGNIPYILECATVQITVLSKCFPHTYTIVFFSSFNNKDIHCMARENALFRSISRKRSINNEWVSYEYSTYIYTVTKAIPQSMDIVCEHVYSYR